MTEQQWLACEDPKPMREFLRWRASSRKWRLFACGCCRQVWKLLGADEIQGVELAEQYADGLVSAQQMTEFRARGTAASAWVAAKRKARRGTAAPSPSAQCCLLRDLFAPFHPTTLSPDWLTWKGDVVMRLTRAAYDERALPSGHLDPVRLAVLADALEAAGATGEIVAHLRGPGSHVRGCWAVDLLLGKN